MYSIIRLKIPKNIKTSLKITLIIGLKSQKKVANIKAQLEWKLTLVVGGGGFFRIWNFDTSNKMFHILSKIIENWSKVIENSSKLIDNSGKMTEISWKLLEILSKSFEISLLDFIGAIWGTYWLLRGREVNLFLEMRL